MRRLGWIVTVLCLALLCACAQQAESPEVYEIEYEGTLYTVDLIEQTFTFDGNVCRYEINSDVTFRVTYPDGSTYWRDQSERKETTGWSDDYNSKRYVSGEVLWKLLGQRSGTEDNGGEYLLIGVVLIAVGAFYAIAPRAGWKLNHGRQTEDVQPTERALMFNRTIGMVAIAAGLACIFLL